MKINLFKKAGSALLVITALTIVSCSNNPTQNNSEAAQTANENAPQFEDSLVNNVYQHYIHLKTALVNNDDSEAKNGAESLETVLTAAENTEVAAIAADIKSAGDIEARRAFFDNLSESLTSFFKSKKLVSGVIYKQHCPMANNDNGGSWLSSEKEIRNPYYGDKMLKCGTIEEEIK